MHDQGYVHRDINTGNVLLSLDPNEPIERRGFISDVELAERIGENRYIPMPVSLLKLSLVLQLTFRCYRVR